MKDDFETPLHPKAFASLKKNKGRGRKRLRKAGIEKDYGLQLNAGGPISEPPTFVQNISV